jgi:tetratricopeptide (TPR) repeat protein
MRFRCFTDTFVLLSFLGILTGVLLSSGRAHAENQQEQAAARSEQDVEPAPAGSEQEALAARVKLFREHIGRAMEHYQAGRYAQAVEEYQAAYRLEARPLLLFNIAQVHRKAGQAKEALSFYERFLLADPHSQLAPEVQEYVNTMHKSAGPSESAAPKDAASPDGADNFLGSEEQRQALFRQHIDSGGVKYQAGEYGAAIGEYWTAYSLKPLPIIIYNIAQAHRKAERFAEALALYERYLREDPTTALLTEVQGYIAQSRERLLAPKLEEERRSAERLAQANAALKERLAEVAEIEHQIVLMHRKAAPKPLYRRAWFWVALGAAATGAALTVGLSVGLTRRQLPDADLGLRTLDY